MTVIVAPVLEEFVFRGWIQGTIERQFGPLIAVRLVALAFAFTHSGMEWPVFTFASGCLFGATIWATRSIWSSVVLHAAANLTVAIFVTVKRVVGTDMMAFFQHDFFYTSIFLLMTSAVSVAAWMIRKVKSEKAAAQLVA
jgi:membrane protease YdiL (CAAX protease family)